MSKDKQLNSEQKWRFTGGYIVSTDICDENGICYTNRGIVTKLNHYENDIKELKKKNKSLEECVFDKISDMMDGKQFKYGYYESDNDVLRYTNDNCSDCPSFTDNATRKTYYIKDLNEIIDLLNRQNTLIEKYALNAEKYEYEYECFKEKCEYQFKELQKAESKAHAENIILKAKLDRIKEYVIDGDVDG